jgi:hypothetical protein
MKNNCPHCKESGFTGSCIPVTEEEKDSCFNVEPLPPFPAGENPYHHDFFNMGTPVGNNLTIMFAATNKEFAKYIIIVNNVTGERIKVSIKE